MSQQSSVKVQATPEKVGAHSYRRNRGRGRPCRCCGASETPKEAQRVRRQIEEAFEERQMEPPDGGWGRCGSSDPG